jgi:hypothetical protein
MQDDIPPRGAPPPELAPTEAAPPASPARPKRNLLFSSSARKDRESAPGAADLPPASFEDAWPKVDRGRNGDVPPQRRSQRTPLGAPEANAGAAPERSPSPAPSETQPGVTVLKSGVVDGMAYTLYADGSIEATLPHGTVRFGSIAELRAHIESNS